MKAFLCLIAALFPLTLFGQSVSRTELKNTNTQIDARMALRDVAVSNAVRSTHIRVEDFGAVTNQANFETNWVAAVKTASARGGGLVTLETPGVYLLYNAGTNVFTTAFRKSALFTNILNVEFRGGAGVEIRLHDNQQRNSGAAGALSLSNGPVDLVYNYRCTNFTFSGAWTLNGNTAGQTAWTNASPRDNYTQVTSGNLIRGTLCQNVSVIGSGGFIVLSNVFSNPIEFAVNNNAQVRNVKFYNVGEGMQFSQSKDNVFQNLWMYDLNSTMVGDCYETATCTNTYASEIYAFHSGTNHPASFWDAGGSRSFSINGFYGEWPFGFGFGEDAFNSYPQIDNYRIENGTLRGEGTAGYFGFGGGTGGGLISQVKFIGFDTAIYSDTTQRVNTAISDCTFFSNRVAISMQSISTLDINRNIFRSNTVGLQVTRVFPVELTDTNDGPTIHVRGNSFETNVWGILFATDGSHNYATRGQYGLNHYVGNGTHMDWGGTYVGWNTNEPVAAGATINLNALPGFTNGTAQWRGDNFVTLGSDSSLIRRFEILTGVGLGYSNVNNGSLLVYGPDDGSLWLSIMDGSFPKRLGRISETVGAGEGLFEIANAGIGALVVTQGLTLRARAPRSIPAIDGNTNLANLSIGTHLWLDTNTLTLNATGVVDTTQYLADSNTLAGLATAGIVDPITNRFAAANIFTNRGKLRQELGLMLPSLTASRPLILNASGDVTNAVGTPDGTKFLRDDGTLAVPAGGSGTPGGNSGDMQFNEAGVLDGTNRVHWNRTSEVFRVRGTIQVTNPSTTTKFEMARATGGSSRFQFSTGGVDVISFLFAGDGSGFGLIDDATPRSVFNYRADLNTFTVTPSLVTGGGIANPGTTTNTGAINNAGPVTNWNQEVSMAQFAGQPSTYSFGSSNANGNFFTFQSGLISSNMTVLLPTNTPVGLTRPVMVLSNLVYGASGTSTGQLTWVDSSALGYQPTNTNLSTLANAAQVFTRVLSNYLHATTMVLDASTDVAAFITNATSANVAVLITNTTVGTSGQLNITSDGSARTFSVFCDKLITMLSTNETVNATQLVTTASKRMKLMWSVDRLTATSTGLTVWAKSAL